MDGISCEMYRNASQSEQLLEQMNYDRDAQRWRQLHPPRMQAKADAQGREAAAQTLPSSEAEHRLSESRLPNVSELPQSCTLRRYEPDADLGWAQNPLSDAVGDDCLALDIVPHPGGTGSEWLGCPIRSRVSGRVTECSESTP